MSLSVFFLSFNNILFKHNDSDYLSYFNQVNFPFFLHLNYHWNGSINRVGLNNYHTDYLMNFFDKFVSFSYFNLFINTQGHMNELYQKIKRYASQKFKNNFKTSKMLF